MKLEHIALDVADPEATIAWWCANLGFRRLAPDSPFILDDSGAIGLEIYRSRETKVAPDYARQDAMTFHLALVVEEVAAEAARLVAAGARLERLDVASPDFHIAFLRDPFGLAFQLCRRAKKVALNPLV